MLLFDKLKLWHFIIPIISVGASFIAGFYVVFKFYKESIAKCIALWIITSVIGCLLFMISIIAPLWILLHILGKIN
jgi:hypothetical protein